MKRKRFSDEQIIDILHAHKAGVPLAELARECALLTRFQAQWVKLVDFRCMQV